MILDRRVSFMWKLDGVLEWNEEFFVTLVSFSLISSVGTELIRNPRHTIYGLVQIQLCLSRL